MKKIRVLLTTVLMLCMSAGLASTAYAAESLKTIYPNEVRTNGTEVTTNNGYEFYNYVTSNGGRPLLERQHGHVRGRGHGRHVFKFCSQRS